MKKLIAIVIFSFSFFVSQGQIQNVCGSDSIILQADNYDNGIVEWQESLDSTNWVTIPEIAGIIYKFLPTQSKYYRAVVKTSTCEPLLSSVTLVQVLPVANAGIDRTVGGTTMTLLGNKVNGAKGTWNIIEGNGGNILDPSNENSEFTGVYNQNYKLVWSLSNLCGQSSDTVAIKFEEIVSKNNFIVVDKTDSILSDSTEIASGIYRIKFSDPSINVADSVMLIGMREDISFLRKVNAFTFQDSIYTFITSQGTFQDLFKSGVLNIGDAVNQAIKANSSQMKSAKIFPTRKTLRENSDNKGIKILYVKANNSENNLELKSASTNSNQGAFTIPLPSTKISNEDESVTYSFSDAYIKIAPKFVLDYKYTFPATLTNLRLGVDNGEFEYNFKTELTATKEASLKKDIKIINVDLLITFMAGPVPVDIDAIFAVKASCDMGISASMNIAETYNNKINLSAMVEGDNVNNLRLTNNASVTSTHEVTSAVIGGKASAEFKIGPSISFMAYGIIGPYLNLWAKLDMSICGNTDKNWSGEGSVGFEGDLGAKAEIVVDNFFFPKVEMKLFDFNYPLFNNAFAKYFKMPNQLELLSGNFQTGIAGQKLPVPIRFRVLSSNGFGIPFVSVRFELENGDGAVNQKVVLSDGIGNAEVDWTLGTNPQNKLKVSVLGCDNDDIENSPIYIYANSTTATEDCTNSNLAISLKTSQGNMYPSVSGGSVPYSYSKNGTDYSSQVPTFNTLIPGKYIVYAKDKNGCSKTRAFTINPIDACANSTLSLDVLVQPNILTITGKNGKAPYKYSIDNTDNFNLTNIYNKVSTGKHTIYIKDANGCVATKDVTIETPTTTAIKASYPIQNAIAIPVSGISFQWVAANYATNQVYDIYLKKGSEAYSLIASNISTTSYTYPTALATSSNYTWKLDVKGNDGAVIDSREFSFSTASANSATPTEPALLQPANGSTFVWLPTTLQWTVQSGDFKYDLYLDDINATKLMASNLNNAQYTIDNLVSGITYYWKVKIKSILTGECATSAVWSFVPKQSATATVTDIDGNIYHTVTIGTQVWMVENLKATRYNDGTDIPNVTDNTEWGTLSTGAYCWYNNDVSNKNPYGTLYNWYAVNTEKLAPKGWHVPTDAEWTTLTDYLTNNGFGYQGSGSDIAKSMAATSGWNSNSSVGTVGNDPVSNNSSGFTALPGGYHNGSAYIYIGIYGNWWSSTSVGSNSSGAFFRSMKYNSNIVYKNSVGKVCGYSVRCVRDAPL